MEPPDHLVVAGDVDFLELLAGLSIARFVRGLSRPLLKFSGGSGGLVGHPTVRS
jgi:hypothetical protein